MVENDGVYHNVGAYGEDKCVVCYSIHHRVMSQARDDYEGFFKAHMTEEEKVIVHVETSLSVYRDVWSLSLYSTLAHARTLSPTH